MKQKEFARLLDTIFAAKSGEEMSCTDYFDSLPRYAELEASGLDAAATLPEISSPHASMSRMRRGVSRIAGACACRKGGGSRVSGRSSPGGYRSSQRQQNEFRHAFLI